MKLALRSSLCAALALCVPVLSFGLTFTNIWDGSVTALPNAATFESDILLAEKTYTSNFSDPINITIQVDYSNSNKVLGESQSETWTPLTYAQIRNALIADAKTPDDVKAIASLPAIDPSGGRTFILTTAEAKALPALGLAFGGTDGTFTFGNQSYALDPNNRAVPGAYDFIGTASHEIAEIMGRIPGITSANTASPFDLFRYSAAGVRNFVPWSATPTYFSIDGGVTKGRFFNNVDPGGADPQDWDGAAPDSYNAFGTLGEEEDVTKGDLQVMDVLGYDRVLSSPEPSTYAVMAGGLGLLLLRRRRK